MALCLRLNKTPDEVRSMTLSDHRHLIAYARMTDETSGGTS